MVERVIFLCTGNSARSQMAEAFLRNYCADRYEVYSAGLEPKGLNPLAVEAMKGVGIDISGQRSKGVSEYLGKLTFRYLITVCDNAEKNCPATWPGVTERLHWSFEDPSAYNGTQEEKLARFCQVRDQIKQQIIDWLAS